MAKKAPTPTVHVVMAVHNRRPTTLACLSQLAGQSYQPIKIVVVDDGSTDGTAAAISKEFPSVTALKGDGDLWWTGAMAKGVDHVLADCGSDDLVLSLNDDVTFGEDYVAVLVDACRSNGRAVTGSFCSVHGDPTSVINQGVRVDWRRSRLTPAPGLLAEALREAGRDPDAWTAEDLDAIGVLEGFDYLFGRGTLIPVEVFKSVGNFDAEAFPHYYGDSELTYRAGRAGCELILSLRARIETAAAPTDAAAPGAGHLSLAQAWGVLTSRRSAYELASGLRFIDRCCPKPYRLRNKLRFVRTAMSLSVGRTRLGSAAAWPIRKALRAGGRRPCP